MISVMVNVIRCGLFIRNGGEAKLVDAEVSSVDSQVPA
jgi:hypothetical protein